MTQEACQLRPGNDPTHPGEEVRQSVRTGGLLSASKPGGALTRSAEKPSLEPLEPVNRPSIQEVIVERLCSYISAHDLKPGARLPAETEIATTLNVSRSSVREAISGMVAYGLLERRTGDGTYITSRVSNMVIRPLALRFALDPRTISDVIEFRKAVEAECAYLAAERASPADRAMIDVCLQRIVDAGDDAEGATKADFAFHMEIARVAGNPILFDVLNYLGDLVYELHLATTKVHGVITPAAHAYHTAIADAITKGKPAKARELMYAHLQNVDEDFRKHTAQKQVALKESGEAPAITRAPKGRRRQVAPGSGALTRGKRL